MAGQGTRRVAVAPEYNHLDNAGFELNQRGAASYTTNGVVTLDRWFISLIGSSTVSASQITSTVGSGGKSLQMAYTHVAGGGADIAQRAEHFAQLAGRVVTFAVTLKSTVSASCHLYLFDGTTQTFSAYNAGTGSQRLVVTATLGAGATQLMASLRCDVASCTVEANDATLVVGGVAADYVPPHAQADLARCQRYYEVHGGVNPSMQVIGYGAAGTNNGNVVLFAVPKGGTPTVTRNGTWAVVNCSQPSPLSPWTGGYTLLATVTALGAYSFNANSSATTVTAEWNP